MPDIFVSSDTTEMTGYAQDILSNGIIAQFALKYSNANRHKLSHLKSYQALVAELEKRDIFGELVKFAKSRGVEADKAQIAASRELLERAINSNMIYQLQGMLEHVKYVNLDDPTVLKAVEVLENGKAFPEIQE